MRYVIWAGLTIISAMLTGGFSPQLKILGAEPDILLIVMVSGILNERTLTPALFAVVGAICMDMFFAPAIGFYSLPYLITGLTVYLVFYKQRPPKHAMPAVILGIAWVIKELLSAVISFFLGNTFDFFYILLTSTLPGILVNGILMFLLNLALRKLFALPFMKPRLSSIEDEFPELKTGSPRRRRYG